MAKKARVRKHVCDRCRDLFFKPRPEVGEFVPVGPTGRTDRKERKYDWAYRRITRDSDLVPQSVCDDVDCRFGTTWGQLANSRLTKSELMDVIDEVISQRDG